MDRQLEKAIKITRGMSNEMLIIAIKMIDDKYKVQNYHDYVRLIFKEFKCKVSVEKVMDCFTYSWAIEDFILNRSQNGY